MNKTTTLISATAVIVAASLQTAADGKLGYTNTVRSRDKVEFTVGSTPTRVDAGRLICRPPPSDAISCCFDRWTFRNGPEPGGCPAKWKVEGGYMEVAKAGSIGRGNTFADFRLHLGLPRRGGRPQPGRGNSNVVQQHLRRCRCWTPAEPNLPGWPGRRAHGQGARRLST